MHPRESEEVAMAGGGASARLLEIVRAAAVVAAIADLP
jgi:hypothetical protein